MNCVEICAGAGGQALGLELAGFRHDAAIENDAAACATLQANRPSWNTIEADVRSVSGYQFRGIDLLAGGVPCPPFSMAGKQLGGDDERDLFPTALRLIEEASPRSVLLENVRGLSTKRFGDYREQVLQRLHQLGYRTSWKVLNASDFGVPQLRPRFILVALQGDCIEGFEWPAPIGNPPTVGQTLHDLMGSRGWAGADSWARAADAVAPTLVGGSKKHGGPDLGPTRSKAAWRKLQVDGNGVANEAPDQTFPESGFPRLTVRMAARIQGFPDHWDIQGRKTAAYRQVGNAFPPPVAYAVGRAIASALGHEPVRDIEEQHSLFSYAR